MNELEKFVSEKAKERLESKETAVSVSAPNKSMSYAEKAKEIVGAIATEEAIKDDDLKRGVVDRRKAALLNSADADMKREEAENKKAETQLQEANYDVYSGVANYAGIKKPLPKKMQSFLFAILAAFQTIYLILFGIPISIINITADGIDSVVKKLGTLTKSAMWIVLVVLAAFVAFTIVQFVRFYLAKFGVI
jgi:hypothetical protein